MNISYFDVINMQKNNLSPLADKISDDSDKYRIFVAVPTQSAPPDGWPILWLLDANITLDFAVKHNPAALIVGIGYPLEDREKIVARRYYDLTEKAAHTNFLLKNGENPPKTGGREKFSRFIRDEIRPLIKKKYAVDDSRHILYGHSLAGLFTLHEMLDYRHSYNFYCAADPSIWWNNHSILERFKSEMVFKNTNIAEKTHLLISTSGKRSERKHLLPDEIKKLEKIRGGPNGKYVFDLLTQYPFLEKEYILKENDSHGTMIAPSIYDCIKFAKIQLNNN